MQIRIKVGDKGQKEMPFSEVCMHMGIAGKKMNFHFIGERAVQLLNEDGTFFSFPILLGEAGFFQDENDFYFHQN